MRYFRITAKVLALLMLSGCENDVRSMDPNRTCCEIYNGSLYGHGVLVGATINGRTSIAILTARHVVTACKGAPVEIKVRDGDGLKTIKLDSADANRWQTIDDASVDSAWIVLSQDELRKNGRLSYVPIDSDRKHYALPKLDAKVRLGCEPTLRSYKLFTKDPVSMPYPHNTTLKEARVTGGSISGTTQPSQSGSPVFETDDKGDAVRLLGTSTGSSHIDNVTVFMTIAQIHTNLWVSLAGEKRALLVSLPHLW